MDELGIITVGVSEDVDSIILVEAGLVAGLLLVVVGLVVTMDDRLIIDDMLVVSVVD